MTSLPLVTVKYIPIGKYICIKSRTKNKNNAGSLCPGKGVGAVVSWAAAMPIGDLASTADVLLTNVPGRFPSQVGGAGVQETPHVGEQSAITRQL